MVETNKNNITWYQEAIQDLYSRLPPFLREVVLGMDKHPLVYGHDFTMVLPCRSTISYQERIACAVRYKREILWYAKSYKMLMSKCYKDSKRGDTFDPSNYSYTIDIPPKPYVIFVNFKWKGPEEDDSTDELEPSEEDLALLQRSLKKNNDGYFDFA